MASIEVGGTVLDVIRKDIKNVHLSVYPPTGRVRIAAPARMSLDTIRLFAISKLAWIRQQQAKIRDQERETRREFIGRESHYVWGKRYLLKVVERDHVPSIELKHSSLVLSVRRGTTQDAREALVSSWYRQLLRTAIPPLIGEWEPRLKVKVAGFYLQQMKTKWGSCNPAAGTIRLNTELVKKPKECLDYIVVHEMVHLIDATHGPRFVAHMDQQMPNWRSRRELLNRLPVRHEQWSY